MSSKKMSKDEILDAAARDLAELMFHITTEYKGYEPEIAALMTNQLGAYIAICAKNPQAAIDEAADHLRSTDYGRIRAAHFGYATLGVSCTKEIERPKGDVLFMGDPRERKRDD